MPIGQEEMPAQASGAKTNVPAQAPKAIPDDGFSKRFAQAASLFGSGMLDEAAKIFIELESAGYNASECLRYLALIFLKKGELEKAESYAKRSLAANPDNAGTVIAQAEISVADGDYLSAIGFGTKAISMRPEEPMFDIKVAEFCIALKAYQKAIGFLNSAIEKHKDRSKVPEQAYLLLGEANMRLNNEPAAVGAYFKALSINPDGKKALDAIDEMRGKRDQAYAAEDAKANPRASALIEKAMEAYSKDDINGMQSSIEEALKFAPRHYRAHWVMGTIHSMSGSSEKAAREFELARECYPSHYLPPNSLGLLYSNRGDLGKALELYTESIMLYPFDAVIFKNRAELLLKMKKREDALEDYNAAIALKPDDSTLADLHTGRAELLVLLGRQEEAEADLNMALKLVPGSQRASKLLSEIKTNLVTGFAGVVGMERLKETLMERIIFPLRRKDLSAKYGLAGGGGILLYGPPGCGKSYIIAALAREAKVNFIDVRVSDIVGMAGGDPIQKLHSAFDEAMTKAPVILFIDELDAFGGPRDSGLSESGRQLVNQFLLEMNEAQRLKDVLVIGATNAPWAVDPALKRPGRFGKSIYVPPPDADTRKALFKHYLKGRPHDADIDFGELAEISDGFSPAEIKARCDDAAAYPWKEAMKTGVERPISMKDMRAAASLKSTAIREWFTTIQKHLEEPGADEFYSELFDDLKKYAGIGLFARPTITFADVAGMDALKKVIRTKIIEPVKNPKLYRKYGMKAGGGILLYGPPGCGKTYIMKAAAGEGGVNFVTAKLSDILSKWVGEAEKNLHNIFETARKNSPCILFFDEIDAIGATRGEGMSESSQQLINQFLTELDGIGSSTEGILVVGATNIPWMVDLALRRSGRLGDTIYVPPPDLASREALLRIHTKGKPVAQDVDFEKLAKMTAGYAAADLKDICDKAISSALSHALETNEETPADMAMFEREIGRKVPIIKAWYINAERELANAPDKEVFKDVFLEMLRLRRGELAGSAH